MTITYSGPSPHGWHSGDETIMQCEHEWWLKHHMKVSLMRVETPEALAVGTLFHAGRARWFALKFLTDDATKASVAQAVRDEAQCQRLPMSLTAQQKAMAVLHDYMAFWAIKPKPVVLAAEDTLGPVTIDGELHTMKPDDISRYPEAGNALCIGEGKTTSAAVSKVFKHYAANNGQILKQVLIYKLAPNGEAKHGPVAGVMLDPARKVYDGKSVGASERFQRQLITVEDRQVVWFTAELADARKRRREIEAGRRPHRNVSACQRIVAGEILVECDFIHLCKFGRSASAEYMVDGVPMSAWRETKGEMPVWG